MIPGDFYSFIDPHGDAMTVQAWWRFNNGYVVKILDGKYAGAPYYVYETDIYLPVTDSLEVFDRD